MSSLLIEDIDDATLVHLRRRADRHGRSPAEEARRIIAEKVASDPEPTPRPLLSEEERADLVRRMLEFGRKPEEPADFRRLREEAWERVPKDPEVQERVRRMLSYGRRLDEPFDLKAFCDDL